MTDTFKEQLLDYLTGKIDIQSGTNHPTFNAVLTYANNLYSFVANNARQPKTGSYRLIKGKDGNGNELDEQLLYGIDQYDNTGFLVVLDSSFNPIQYIDSYASGTKFGIFEELIVDDDGRFYGVEYFFQEETRRFVMLNNILVKASSQANYKVVLRKSYNLPEILQGNEGITTLIKKPLGNKYIFGTTILDGSLLIYKPTLVELTINVGASNEWVEYQYTDNSCRLNSVWASWDVDDNLTFKMICIYTNPPLTNGYFYVISNSNGTMTTDNTFSLPNPGASFKQGIIISENEIYYGCCESDSNGVYNQYIYSVGNSLTQIYKSPNTDVADPTDLMKSTLYTDGLNVFVSFNVPNADDTIDYYMCIIYNGQVYNINFGALTYTTSQLLYATNTFHQFNLYNYYLQLGDMVYIAKSIFNNLSYNGYPYSNVNGLLPNSAILATDTGLPIFARNLYNKVVNDNVTVSTVEIPNTMLNYNQGGNNQIGQEQLYSITNQQLALNTEEINKNIYETVDINFYNTIKMKDSNDSNNEIINFNGAIKVNKSISKDLTYNEAQATKVRINYDNNTSYIVAIDQDTQITIANGVATYSFMIYAPTDKNITNLQIISYDELMVYATINGSFTQGKYYTITQDVYVE